MAKVHDLFIVELAEVIKGYGNDPDDEDPFRLSEFYRFYELPNIAVSRENFEKMRPIEERKAGKWKHDSDGLVWCDTCGFGKERSDDRLYRYCPNCGYRMMEGCENNV